MRKIKAAPYLHCEDTVRTLEIDIFISLLPLLIISTVQNGLRVIMLSAVSMLSALACEIIGNYFKRKKFVLSFEPLTIGLIIAMLCPITAPWWLPASGSLFAVFFARVLLGEYYKNLFKSTSIGWLFMLTVAPARMSVYPMLGVFNSYPIFKSDFSFATTQSIAQSLQTQIKPTYDLTQILIGRVPGGIGTTCIIVMVAVSIYLIYRRAIAWQVTVSMVAVMGVMAAFVDRTGSGIGYSIVFETSATSYLFAAIFIASDITSCPKLSLGRVLYGVFCALMVIVLRYLGIVEHCVVISLIVSNLLSSTFDRIMLYFQNGSLYIKSKKVKVDCGDGLSGMVNQIK